MKERITKRQRKVQEEKLKSAVDLLEIAILETRTADPDEIAGTIDVAVEIIAKVNRFLKTHPNPEEEITETEFVTDRQWYGLARRLEKKNFKEKGRSLSVVSIARAANKFVVNVQSDKKGCLVKKGWREAMRQAATAETN